MTIIVKKLGRMILIALPLCSSCRWNKKSSWEMSPLTADFEWKRIAEPVMKLYTEATDGSNIETKESALVWHHQDADPDFGSCQAMELLDHLENVLANEPVVVKRGQHIVEVKPQVCILCSHPMRFYPVILFLILTKWSKCFAYKLLTTVGSY